MLSPLLRAACVLACLALAYPSHAQETQGQMPDHTHMDHAAHMKQMADAQRQAEVAVRGKDVMPFNLAATTHVFIKNETGGVQQVLAKAAADATQVTLIRQHLQEIQAQFLRGDFSGPGHIHGQTMPGLAELKAARPGQMEISYRELRDGAELSYRSADSKLVQALHRWFDAQLADHGHDAMEGHSAPVEPPAH